ncbi:MAG TPA: transcription elongation factor GreA [Firmicutes bacterium]|nr:transcription elongation factor GreA [Candidatus Fermentithermobacillaceae bacterium]
MTEREIILSPEGKKTFEAELNHLRLVRRREVAERIKAARAFGDLSENAEYEDAKKEQAFVEGRILRLENILRHAVITQNGGQKSDVVRVGSTFTLRDINNGKTQQYTIVGSQEADPGRRRISNESPVGKAVLGRKPGAVVTVTVPAGTFQYEIVSIDQS